MKPSRRRWLVRILGAFAGLSLILTMLVAGMLLWPRVRDSLWLAATPYGALDMAEGLAGTNYRTGAFAVELAATERGPALRITARDDPARVLWESVPGRAFVAAAAGTSTLHESRGMVHVDDDIHMRCKDQRIDTIAPSAGGGVEVRGTLSCPDRAAPYRLALHSESASALAFSLSFDDPRLDRTYLVEKSTPDEGYYGFGAQFSDFDLKGRRLPIITSEQGVGRGLQPLTLGADLTADGAGGHWHSSYASVPHYLTSRRRSLHLSTYEYAVFDMRRDDATIIELHASTMRGRIFSGRTPLDLIEAYTGVVGRMRPLPGWITRGAIVGIQGGTSTVRRRLDQLAAHRAPVAAVWLQDWVGQRRTSFGKQLWWSWTLDREHYPGWSELVSELEARGIRVMTYVNPFLVDVSERGPGHRDYFAEARDRGCLVRTADGGPYLLRNTSFSAGLLDLSAPACWQWTKDILQRELIGTGAAGWMADFGEGFPFDGAIAADIPGDRFHNMYPELWARVNREAIEESGRGDSLTFFSRSGYTLSPRHATLFWLGDQLVSWDAHDGIKTAVTGLLSSGISGFAFNHSDIGGYTTITNPIVDYHRSRELHMRWAELAAWNVVFRTHEGNRPEDNHQFYSDGETLAHFARMAQVYACWEPYRRRLIDEAATRGWPVVRHPYLHYPDDPAVRTLRYQQFLVGADIMVAPVLDPGRDSVEIYLPDGSGDWIELWTGTPRSPGRHRIEAPLGRPAVLHRRDARAGAEIRACLRSHGLLEA